MSQLNNMSANGKHKISNITKLIIFILVFAVVCIGGTAFAIHFINNKSSNQVDNGGLLINNTTGKEDNNGETNKPNTNKVNEDNLKLTGLDERYDNNSLKIEKLTYGEVENGTSLDGTKLYKIDVSYDQISGLKDSAIEKQINDEIKEKSLSLIKDSYKTDKNIVGVQIYATVTGNFGDVLSVSIYCYVNEKNSNDANKYDIICLNYRLDTGKKIDFIDLFTNDAPLNSIIANAAYKKLAWATLTNNMGDKDMNDIDYSSFEEESANMVAYYKMDKVHNFYFTPQTISLFVTGVDGKIDIEMADCYSNIAIYKRFKSQNNLYVDSNIGVKKSLVCTRRYDAFYNYYDDVASNMFGIIILGESKEDKVQKVMNNIKDELNRIMQETKKNIKSDKGIIFRQEAYVYVNNNKIEASISEQTAEMSLEYYKKNIYNVLSEYERRPKASLDVPIVVDNDNVKLATNQRLIKFDLNGNIIK